MAKKNPQHKEILKFILEKVMETGLSPTHHEISARLNLSSAAYHIQTLVDRGLLTTTGAWRSFTPTEKGLKYIGRTEKVFADMMEKKTKTAKESLKSNQRRFVRSPISEYDRQTLEMIHKKKFLTLQAIANELGISKQAVSRRIITLLSKDLVEKRSTSYWKMRELAITDKGMAELEGEPNEANKTET